MSRRSTPSASTLQTMRVGLIGAAHVQVYDSNALLPDVLIGTADITLQVRASIA